MSAERFVQAPAAPSPTPPAPPAPAIPPEAPDVSARPIADGPVDDGAVGDGFQRAPDVAENDGIAPQDRPARPAKPLNRRHGRRR